MWIKNIYFIIYAVIVNRINGSSMQVLLENVIYWFSGSGLILNCAWMCKKKYIQRIVRLELS